MTNAPLWLMKAVRAWAGFSSAPRASFFLGMKKVLTLPGTETMPSELPPETAKSGFLRRPSAMTSRTWSFTFSLPSFSPMPPEISATPRTFPDSADCRSSSGTSGEGTATTNMSTGSGKSAGALKHFTPSMSPA